jgi:tetratricopeptide (TPR) repeat protein
MDEKVNQPYAHIGLYSDVPAESEVLFSLGTIWRIKSITHDKHLCTIELTSCKELDLELDRLPEKYTNDNATFISLGDILHELGDENEAEWCYRKMLDQYSKDDETTGILYYKIGMIQFEKKLYFEAFRNLIEAVSLLRQSKNKQIMTTSSRSIYKYCDELSLLKIYNNIGFIHEKNGKFKEAAQHYEQALEDKSSHTEQVIAYRNFGLLHFRLGNYNAAKEHHETALRLTEVNDICSQEFRKYLKRTNDYLDYIADDEKHKHKKQKTTN